LSKDLPRYEGISGEELDAIRQSFCNAGIYQEMGY
ncbi:unnamed protein product, partial [marine sediment metagenome]